MPAFHRVLLFVLCLMEIAPADAGAAGRTIAIPFEQGEDHRMYIEGTINQSRPLRFLVDTGADGLAVSLATREAAAMKIDDQSENTGSDGVTMVDYSTRNKVSIGGLSRTMGAAVIDYRNRPFDAVLGWQFFEGRVIEIDYDTKMLLVHDSLPDIAGYTRMNTRWIGNTAAIEVVLRMDETSVRAWLSLDTGSNGTVDLTHAFSARHNLKSLFTQTVGTSQFSGSAGKKIRAIDARISALEVQGLQLDHPKVSFTIDEDGSDGDGTIGSEAVQHFNILLDTKTGNVYLRPNRNFGQG